VGINSVNTFFRGFWEVQDEKREGGMKNEKGIQNNNDSSILFDLLFICRCWQWVLSGV
jgi:hypothetical protein